MSLPVLIWALSVCLGLLLGSTWTIQILQSKLQRQAEERRKLNEEWVALRAARQRRSECPFCANRLSRRDSDHASTITRTGRAGTER